MQTKKMIPLFVITGLLCFSGAQLSHAAGHVLYDASKTVPKGTVITESKGMAMKDIVMTVEMQGQKANGIMNRVNEQIRVVTHVSDTHITEVYTKDVAIGSVEMMGQKQPAKEEKEALHGKTVILTKVDGKWTAKFKEGEPTEKQKKKIAKIEKRYNGDDSESEIYGKVPRKIGDTWDVDPTKIDSFGDEGNKLKGTFKMTLKAIEKFEGEDCAVLLTEIDVTGPTGEGDSVMSVKGKAKVYRSLKHLHDLQSVIEGTVTMTGTVNQGVGKLKMVGPAKFKEKAKIKLP